MSGFNTLAVRLSRKRKATPAAAVVAAPELRGGGAVPTERLTGADKRFAAEAGHCDGPRAVVVQLLDRLQKR